MYRYKAVLSVLFIIGIIFIVGVTLCSSDEPKIWTDKEGNIHITDYPQPAPIESETNKLPAIKQTDKEVEEAVKQPNIKHSRSLKETPYKTEASNKPIESVKPLKKTTDVLNKPLNKSSQETVNGKINLTSEQKAGKPPIKINPVQKKIVHRKPITPMPFISLPSKSDFGLTQYIIIALFFMSLLYFLYTLFAIAKRLKLEKPWISFIPIANAFTIIKAGDKPIWWLGLLVVPVINIAAPVMLWMAIYERLMLDRKNGLSMLYISPIALPLIALLFSLFNPSGIILNILFVVYPLAMLFCGSMLILPGYFLRGAVLKADKDEVSGIFERGQKLSPVQQSPVEAEKAVLTKIEGDTALDQPDKVVVDTMPHEPEALSAPEISEPLEINEEPAPIIAETIHAEPSKPAEIKEEITPISETIGGLSADIDLNSVPPGIKVAPTPLPETIGGLSADIDLDSEPAGVKDAPTPIPETIEGLSADIDLDSEPAGVKDAPTPIPETIEGLSADIDLNSEPPGVKVAAVPIPETIEGLSADIDLDSEPAGIKEAAVPLPETIEGLSVDIDLDSEPVKIKGDASSMPKTIEGLSVDTASNSEPALISKSPEIIDADKTKADDEAMVEVIADIDEDIVEVIADIDEEEAAPKDMKKK